MAGAFQPDAFQSDGFQADGAASVTGTATFAQAAATWEAVASERTAANGEWTQAAIWEATALAANPVTSTATWTQAQAWEAAAAEEFTGSATFEQTANWTAQASESIPSTATWSQAASWAALGLNAEDVLAEAEWTQAAASWLAATAQVVTGSGTWEQANTWLAALVEALTSTATWEQGATWEAAGDVDNPAVPVDANGEWTQGATWSAVAGQAGTGTARGPSGGHAPSGKPRFGRLEFEIERGRKRVTHPSAKSLSPLPLRPLPKSAPSISAEAAFVQPPAGFTAHMEVGYSAGGTWVQGAASWGARMDYTPPWWNDDGFLNEIDEDLGMLVGAQ